MVFLLACSSSPISSPHVRHDADDVAVIARRISGPSPNGTDSSAVFWPIAAKLVRQAGDQRPWRVIEPMTLDTFLMPFLSQERL